MRRYTVLSLDFRHIILFKNNSLSSQALTSSSVSDTSNVATVWSAFEGPRW
jgi:hypothetical protein